MKKPAQLFALVTITALETLAVAVFLAIGIFNIISGIVLILFII